VEIRPQERQYAVRYDDQPGDQPEPGHTAAAALVGDIKAADYRCHHGYEQYAEGYVPEDQPVNSLAEIAWTTHQV
jgi:hypothetical protein